MIHGRTRFIYAQLLVASFFVEGIQATIEAQAHVLAARQRSSTSSSTSTSATPTTAFFAADVPRPTTCGSTTISWVYTGSADLLSLEVSNIGVTQNDPSSSSLSASTSPTSTSDDITTTIIGRAVPLIGDITVIIATNLSTTSHTFVWNPVNVPSGQYIISALIPDTSTLTQAPSSFFVRPGTNTSCLVAVTSSSTSGASTRTITPSSVSVAPQPVTSTPLSATTDAINVPLIVGVTIGMAAFVIAVAVIWFCLYRKAKSKARRSGRPNNFAHRWNGLGSTDSRAGFAAKATRKKNSSSGSHLQSHPDSVASTMGPDFDDGVGAEKNAAHLKVNGKASNLFDEQGVALSTLPVLYQQQLTRPTRTHSGSSSTSNVNVFMNNHESLPVKGRSSQRRPSIDSSAYPPSSPISPQTLRDSAPNMSHSHSVSTTGTQHSQQTSQQSSSSSISPQSSLPPPPPPPISPSATASREIKQMNRQSLGRKRKPVPVYDPDQEQQPVSATSPTFVSPLAYSTTNGDSAVVPSLTHKNSFGPGGIESKQLHYLIPDMPMRPVNP